MRINNFRSCTDTSTINHAAKTSFRLACPSGSGFNSSFDLGDICDVCFEEFEVWVVGDGVWGW
jgi:hypothetical protein